MEHPMPEAIYDFKPIHARLMRQNNVVSKVEEEHAAELGHLMAKTYPDVYGQASMETPAPKAVPMDAGYVYIWPAPQPNAPPRP